MILSSTSPRPVPVTYYCAEISDILGLIAPESFLLSFEVIKTAQSKMSKTIKGQLLSSIGSSVFHSPPTPSRHHKRDLTHLQVEVAGTITC
jgi:hypothetical protein